MSNKEFFDAFWGGVWRTMVWSITVLAFSVLVLGIPLSWHIVALCCFAVFVDKMVHMKRRYLGPGRHMAAVLRGTADGIEAGTVDPEKVKLRFDP